jgi:hypothetical protein
LTLDLNLSYITTLDNLYESNAVNITNQNSRIAAVLKSVFPINTGVDPLQISGTPSLKETGVPVNSEARVLLSSTSNSYTYQIRLFRADQSNGGVWVSKSTGGSYTVSNVISEFSRN